jgi:O-antigen ligase
MSTRRDAIRDLSNQDKISAVVLGLLVVWGVVAISLGTTALLVLPLLLVVLYVGVRIDPAWLFSLALASSIFSGYASQLGLPIGADRILLAGGLISLIVHLAPRTPERRVRWRPVHLALAAVAVYVVISAFAVRTLTDTDGFFALLDKLGLVPFISFVLAPIVFPDARRRRILLGVLTVVGAYLGLTAFLEGLGLRDLTWPSYIRDPNLGIHFDRARGPFLEAAGDGLGLFECAVAAAVGVTMWRTQRARIAGLLVTATCMFGTLFTLTRSVWIGASVGILAGMVVAPTLRKWILPVVGAGLIALLAAFTFIPGLSQSAQTRASDQYPVWDRQNLASAAVNAIKDNPVFGVGWHQFPAKSTDYFVQQGFPISAIGFEVHNIFLLFGSELGIVGLTLWLGALLLGIGGAILRRGPPELLPWRLGLIAIVVQWLVILNLTPGSYAFSAWFVWMWAGIVSTKYISEPRSTVDRSATREDGAPAAGELVIA